jgi:hypothetical protein
MIFCNQVSLADDLSSGFVFLDTNTLIALSEVPEFLHLMLDIKEKGCQLLTIPPVTFEFARTDSLKKYTERIQFLNQICSTYPIEKNTDTNSPLFFVFNKVSPAAGYVDLFLYQALYKFSHAYVLTENHSHFPLSILDREHIITIDTGQRSIRNYAFYKMNMGKIGKVIEANT